MQMVYNRSLFLDKQLMKMQENPNEIPEGETPHTVSMFARQVGGRGVGRAAWAVVGSSPGSRSIGCTERMQMQAFSPCKAMSHPSPSCGPCPAIRTWWTWPSPATASL